MWVAFQRMRSMIRWRMDRCLERGELTGRAIDRVEAKIRNAEEFVREHEFSEAVAELTSAAITLGRNMFVQS